jgi:signal peptidase I
MGWVAAALRCVSRTGPLPLLTAAVVFLTGTLYGCGTTAHSVKTTASSPNPIPAPAAGFFRVKSESMAPTFTRGTTVGYRTATPEIGDIAVFHPPEGAEQEWCGPTPHVVRSQGAACSEPVRKPSRKRFVKRIVAGPGDEIYIREGHVYRKKPGASTFTREAAGDLRRCGRSFECDFPVPIRIPAGEWYMLGDNRGLSDDSRLWGPVPTGWIDGIVSDASAAPTV